LRQYEEYPSEPQNPPRSGKSVASRLNEALANLTSAIEASYFATSSTKADLHLVSASEHWVFATHQSVSLAQSDGTWIAL